MNYPQLERGCIERCYFCVRQRGSYNLSQRSFKVIESGTDQQLAYVLC